MLLQVTYISVCKYPNQLLKFASLVSISHVFIYIIGSDFKPTVGTRSSTRGENRTGLIVGVVVSSVVVGLLLLLAIFCCRKKSLANDEGKRL